jgi:hypothetical protein
MTNEERRAMVGLEPFGDDRDTEVWLPFSLTNVYAVTTPAGVGAVPPAPRAPAGPAEEGSEAEELPGKAGQREFLGLRRTVDTRWVPKIRSDMEALLAEQREDIIRKVKNTPPDTLKRHLNDPDYWWSEKKEDARLAKVLVPATANVASVVADRTVALMGDTPGKAALERAGQQMRVTMSGMTVPQIILQPTFTFEQPQGQPINVNVPEQAAPVVNVAAGAAPQVTVNVPEQPAPIVNVEQPAKASMDEPVDVRIVADTTTRVKRVYRDKAGRIEGVVEGQQ